MGTHPRRPAPLRPAGRLCTLLVAGWGCLSLPAVAAGADAPPRRDEVTPATRDAREVLEVPDAPADGAIGDRLDRLHDRLFRGMQRVVERTDSRFAGDGERLPVPAAPFRIGGEGELRSDPTGGFKANPRLDFDILLRLPNLEQRLRIFVTSEDVQESPDQLYRSNTALRAGVRYNLLRWFDFDVGLRADFPDAAFASVRWQRLWGLGEWDVQPFAKAYVQTGDGLGATGGVTLDRWVGQHWLLRSSSYANWLRDTGETAWTQTLLVAHAREVIRFGRYGPMVRGRDLARGYGLQLLASGPTTSGAATYEASAFVKLATGKRWLYWHFAPLVRWEKAAGWDPEPGFRIGFDALFWDLARN